MAAGGGLSMGAMMATVVELRERYAHLLAQGAPLADKSVAGELTGDEAERFDAIARETRGIADELKQAEERQRQAESMRAEASRMNESAGRATAKVAAERGPVYHGLRDIGSMFVQSDQYRASLASASRYGVTGRENAVLLGGINSRGLVYAGDLPNDMIPDQVLPGVIRGQDVPLTVRSVLGSATTQSDAITYILEDNFDNQADHVAEAEEYDAESVGVKPESGLTFTQETASVITVAHWLPVTRQALADAGQLAAIINDRLVRGLAEKVDDGLLNGLGSMDGILGTSGIQDLDSTYFSGNPVRNVGTANEILNRIHRAITEVRVTGKAMPSFILMHPADIEVINTMANGVRGYLAGGPYTTQPARIWGLPVVESQAIAEGTALVGDGSQATVFDRMGATIYTTDSHADFFIRNIVTVLAEQRLALAVYRPAAFAAVDIDVTITVEDLGVVGPTGGTGGTGATGPTGPGA